MVSSPSTEIRGKGQTRPGNSWPKTKPAASDTTHTPQVSPIKSRKRPLTTSPGQPPVKRAKPRQSPQVTVKQLTGQRDILEGNLTRENEPAEMMAPNDHGPEADAAMLMVCDQCHLDHQRETISNQANELGQPRKELEETKHESMGLNDKAQQLGSSTHNALTCDVPAEQNKAPLADDYDVARRELEETRKSLASVAGRLEALQSREAEKVARLEYELQLAKEQSQDWERKAKSRSREMSRLRKELQRVVVLIKRHPALVKDDAATVSEGVGYALLKHHVIVNRLWGRIQVSEARLGHILRGLSRMAEEGKRFLERHAGPEGASDRARANPTQVQDLAPA